jgi:hypothetical protein
MGRPSAATEDDVKTTILALLPMLLACEPEPELLPINAPPPPLRAVPLTESGESAPSSLCATASRGDLLVLGSQIWICDAVPCDANIRGVRWVQGGWTWQCRRTVFDGYRWFASGNGG